VRPIPAPWRPAFGPINSGGTSTNPTLGSSAATIARPVSPESPATSNSNAPLNQERQASLQAGATDSQAEPSGVAKVTRTFNSLPNSAGQVWREYDISPYTSRITNTPNPQQAIIDWILKETGTEMWFNHPLGILSATETQLYVYHTPAIQETVRRLVDRFVYTRGQIQAVDITLLTVDNPNWRGPVYSRMQPIETKSLGVEAFLLSKENAAVIINQLSRRGDAKLINSGKVSNHDGQPFMLRNTKLTQFFNRLQWIANQTPNYQPLTANVDEGYSVSISCLSSLDSRTIEAIIKCDIDQIERLTNVNVDVPNQLDGSQTVNLQIPQIVSWRLHERFRWSGDQVLLLTCGVVAGIEQPGSKIGPLIPMLGNNLRTKRAEALLFIDYRGPAQESNLPQASRDSMVPIPARR
jgi:hypothetical protein